MSHLKKISIIVVLTITLVAVFNINGQINGTPQRNVKIKIISFTDMHGQNIRARVLEDNRNQIIVTQPLGSKIETVIYSRAEIQPDTLFQQTISEFEYWQSMAEYFSNRTWDFENDSDDFIQAIRCYENAKDIVSAIRGPEHEMTIDIAKKIEKLEQKKQQWVEKLKERTKLRQLEAQDQLADRLESIGQQINANNEMLNAVDKNIAELITHMEILDKFKDTSQKNSLALDKQIGDLIKKIDSNTREIDYMWRRYRDKYEYYYRYSPNTN